MLIHNGPAEVLLDPKLVKKILLNLVSNALKFSGENMTVHIKTIVTSDNIQLTVGDEGMGISAVDREHLFQRFFRGKNAANIPGTGLGLNIVSRYVELMNGFIEVESELEKGTTFIINFPILKVQ
jgi:signal transduction histidine kinase